MGAQKKFSGLCQLPAHQDGPALAGSLVLVLVLVSCAVAGPPPLGFNVDPAPMSVRRKRSSSSSSRPQAPDKDPCGLETLHAIICGASAALIRNPLQQPIKVYHPPRASTIAPGFNQTTRLRDRQPASIVPSISSIRLLHPIASMTGNI